MEIDGFSKNVDLNRVRENEYVINPSKYLELKMSIDQHRTFKDIAEDYNRIIRSKNAIKITFNKTAAKRLEFPIERYEARDGIDISRSFEVVGEKAEKENYISLTANDRICIKCSTKDEIPILIQDFIRSWTQFERYLNNEENRLLAEFRDALLQELMTGNISI